MIGLIAGSSIYQYVFKAACQNNNLFHQWAITFFSENGAISNAKLNNYLIAKDYFPSSNSLVFILWVLKVDIIYIL